VQRPADAMKCERAETRQHRFANAFAGHRAHCDANEGGQHVDGVRIHEHATVATGHAQVEHGLVATNGLGQCATRPAPGLMSPLAVIAQCAHAGPFARPTRAAVPVRVAPPESTIINGHPSGRTVAFDDFSSMVSDRYGGLLQVEQYRFVGDASMWQTKQGQEMPTAEKARATALAASTAPLVPPALAATPPPPLARCVGESLRSLGA